MDKLNRNLTIILVSDHKWNLYPYDGKTELLHYRCKM